jgi:hypothetical protein
MDGDRSRECAHSGCEIAEHCRPARDAHSGGEVASHYEHPRATHAGGEIPVDVIATAVASLTTREIGLSLGARLTDVRVDIAADVGPVGVNHCFLQQESSFGFSLSKRQRHASDANRHPDAIADQLSITRYYPITARKYVLPISDMLPVVPMRATTVRFSEDLWQLLEDESTRQGISAAQFVRDAAIVRLAFLAGRRGDAESEQTIETIAERAMRRQQNSRGSDTAVLAPERLTELRRTLLLDSPPEQSFDRLTQLTATVLNVPIALVSLVDSDRQFFKSCLGLPQPWASQRGTPLSHSFCQHVVESRRPLVVSDAREHPLLKDNPAIRDLGVIAYVGAPLITPAGHVLGTLCAIDHQPRHWTPEQVEILCNLAGSVLSEIQLHAAQHNQG